MHILIHLTFITYFELAKVKFIGHLLHCNYFLYVLCLLNILTWCTDHLKPLKEYIFIEITIIRCLH